MALNLIALAENAVRHGIRRSETGAGTVTVSTRETETHYEITVADDGAGFDPAAPEASPARPPMAGGSACRQIGICRNVECRGDPVWSPAPKLPPIP